VYGDEDMHSVVRQLCVDYMVIVSAFYFGISITVTDVLVR